MINKLFLKYKELIFYGFFGVLTVIVNIVIFKLLRVLGVSYLYANTIAFFVAVLFAYYTNTKYVFVSKFTKENFVSFMSMRIGTLFIDNIGMYIFINFGIEEMISKYIVNILIIVINYICSKFFIFKK